MISAFRFAFAFLFLISCRFAFAQSQDSVTFEFRQSAELAAVTRYHTGMGGQAHLFSGSEFIPYNGSASGEHQFYKYPDLQKSTITFERLLYKDVPLLYDIVNEDLIVGRYRENGKVDYLKIDKNKVSEFKLGNHAFIRIDEAKDMEKGFYEQVYKGGLQVLAKRKKTFKKEVVTITFPTDNNFYILKDGIYHPVKTKGSVLKLLKDHKKELSQFLRANNILFLENREYAIKELAAHYDKLTQAK